MVLVIGWNNKICMLLATLDEMVAPGTKVEIYSPRAPEEREEELTKFQAVTHQFVNVNVYHKEVEKATFTSRRELDKLNHKEHELIFILADRELYLTEKAADEKTAAILVQLKDITTNAAGWTDEERKRFNPVVEMSDKDAIKILTEIGFPNIIDSSSLVSQALAAVAENGGLNAIFSELCLMRSNEFDILPLETFLDEDEPMPAKISFGEVAVRVAQSYTAVPIAWSDMIEEEDEDLDGDGIPDDDGQKNELKKGFVVNPKDKAKQRIWSPSDRIVVIREKITGPDGAKNETPRVEARHVQIQPHRIGTKQFPSRGSAAPKPLSRPTSPADVATQPLEQDAFSLGASQRLASQPSQPSQSNVFVPSHGLGAGLGFGSPPASRTSLGDPSLPAMSRVSLDPSGDPSSPAMSRASFDPSLSTRPLG